MKKLRIIKTTRDIIGLAEIVRIIGPEKEKLIRARIDTGADVCSIDKALAKELKLGPVEQLKRIKSAHGVRERPIIRVRIQINKREFKNIRFTLAEIFLLHHLLSQTLHGLSY